MNQGSLLDFFSTNHCREIHFLKPRKCQFDLYEKVSGSNHRLHIDILFDIPLYKVKAHPYLFKNSNRCNCFFILISIALILISILSNVSCFTNIKMNCLLSINTIHSSSIVWRIYHKNNTNNLGSGLIYTELSTFLQVFRYMFISVLISVNKSKLSTFDYFIYFLFSPQLCTYKSVHLSTYCGVVDK